MSIHTVSLGSIKIALAGPAVNARTPARTVKYNTLNIFLAVRLRQPRRPPQSGADQKYDMRTKEKPEVARPKGRPSSCKREINILCSMISPTLATTSSSYDDFRTCRDPGSLSLT